MKLQIPLQNLQGTAMMRMHIISRWTQVGENQNTASALMVFNMQHQARNVFSKQSLSASNSSICRSRELVCKPTDLNRNVSFYHGCQWRLWHILEHLKYTQYE